MEIFSEVKILREWLRMKWKGDDSIEVIGYV